MVSTSVAGGGQQGAGAQGEARGPSWRGASSHVPKKEQDSLRGFQRLRAGPAAVPVLRHGVLLTATAFRQGAPAGGHSGPLASVTAKHLIAQLWRLRSQALGELAALPRWGKTLGVHSRRSQAGLILPWDATIRVTFTELSTNHPKASCGMTGSGLPAAPGPQPVSPPASPCSGAWARGCPFCPYGSSSACFLVA